MIYNCFKPFYSLPGDCSVFETSLCCFTLEVTCTSCQSTGSLYTLGFKLFGNFPWINHFIVKLATSLKVSTALSTLRVQRTLEQPQCVLCSQDGSPVYSQCQYLQFHQYLYPMVVPILCGRWS